MLSRDCSFYAWYSKGDKVECKSCGAQVSREVWNKVLVKTYPAYQERNKTYPLLAMLEDTCEN